MLATRREREVRHRTTNHSIAFGAGPQLVSVKGEGKGYSEKKATEWAIPGDPGGEVCIAAEMLLETPQHLIAIGTIKGDFVLEALPQRTLGLQQYASNDCLDQRRRCYRDQALHF